MEKDSKIYIAGHRGLVGSAITRHLKKNGFHNLLLKSHAELELADQQKVFNFFKKQKPEYVFLAAAKVGGILSNNSYPGQFIYSNLQIQTAVIHACHIYDVKKLLFLGSSCIYPKFAPQPISEDALLSGKLEPTNQAYAIAKIAGIIMCQSYNAEYNTNFISVMPTNLYGSNDNYDLYNSHVLPALLRKIHEAKINDANTVEIWGTGNVRREFLFVDDLAEACVFLMNNYDDDEIINIGTGEDITIRELAETIAEVVGYNNRFHFDKTKPEGTPKKLLNVEKINKLGWKAKTDLRTGLKLTYEDFLKMCSEL
ncbi:MAG: GDP-L-fucose synthase [Candidatus Lokiarchaeota archaeon]|nr:GDP-L-fucose synthase [Candidatus Lokiarchaeota archaeon]